MQLLADAEKSLITLSTGAFLTTQLDDTINTMTIGWGSIGYIWRKPIFLVMVRPSRFTYNLIEKSNEFTVSIPTPEMTQALAMCGTKSGRDTDKIKAAGLTLLDSRKIKTPVIANCLRHYECKVLFKQAMTSEEISPELTATCYAAGDLHTLYFGEIICTYTE